MPRHQQIVELHERETRLFSRSDLIDTHGRSLILPETRALSAIELREALDGIQLRVLGYIGYLPLTSDIVLNLRPKFPTESLWYMLDIANDSFEEVLPVVRSYQLSDETPPHHLLVRAFCQYLGKLLASGLWRGYERARYEGYYQPKVLFGQTLGRFAPRGNEISTVSEVFAFTSDLPPNRFLKAACLKFLNLTPRDPSWIFEREKLASALEALQNIRATSMFLEDLDAADQVPMRIRPLYRGALAVYAILLGYTRIGFAYAARGSELPSFLFCLDDVFENFVRNTCRSGLRPAGLSVADGNKPSNFQSLFADNRRFPIKPDLICRRGNAVIAIGEVKYKPRIEESDRYQVISHVIAAGAPLGIWISPAATDEDAGLEYIGKMPTGAKFYHFKLYIGGQLPSACARMVAALEALLNTTG
jgi:5-methylcytosine-specific restriction endonuclease McrBC regulatory subunit McrC